MVLALVIVAWKSDPADLLISEEWSFAAAILMGQSISKCVRRCRADASQTGSGIALASSLIFLFGVTPALVILAVILSVAPKKVSELPPVLIGLQFVIFIGGVVVFYLFGVGHLPRAPKQSP